VRIMSPMLGGRRNFCLGFFSLERRFCVGGELEMGFWMLEFLDIKQLFYWPCKQGNSEASIQGSERRQRT
jgi:hypothetical protein